MTGPCAGESTIPETGADDILAQGAGALTSAGAVSTSIHSLDNCIVAMSDGSSRWALLAWAPTPNLIPAGWRVMLTN